MFSSMRELFRKVQGYIRNSTAQLSDFVSCRVFAYLPSFQFMIMANWPFSYLALQGDWYWPGHWWTRQVWSFGDPAGVSCSQGPHTCHVWSTNDPPAVWRKSQGWRHCGGSGEEEDRSIGVLTSIQLATHQCTQSCCGTLCMGVHSTRSFSFCWLYVLPLSWLGLF